MKAVTLSSMVKAPFIKWQPNVSALAAKFYETNTCPRISVSCSGWPEACVLVHEGLALQVKA